MAFIAAHHSGPEDGFSHTQQYYIDLLVYIITYSNAIKVRSKAYIPSTAIDIYV